jgi:MFS family permease
VSRGPLLALLVALAIITFLDRLCISVAGPRMQDELGIGPDRWGWVLGAFVLSYGLFEIPTGAMGDRFGQRSVLARIVLWWSAFTALTGFASGFAPLVATRFLFGAGEAGAYPNMAGVVSRCLPASDRAAAQGYIWGASRFGGALSPLLVVPLQAALGWRACFWIFGAVGVAWAVVWWWLYRDPPTVATARPAPWGLIARSGQVWTIVAMYGCYAWGTWFYFAWLPTYLVKGRGFTTGEMAVFASLPFLLGTVANLAGGHLSDFACRKLGPRRGRTIVGTVCLAVAAVLIVATATTASREATVVLLTLGFGVMDLMLPSAWAICLDVGGANVGAVSGVMNTAGQLGGFLCTVLFGELVARTGDYNLPLFAIAAMVALASVLFHRIRIEPICA